MSKVMIFGAGKIARGFIGQLMFLSHVETVFVDVSEKLVEQMKTRGKYTVHVLGAPDKDSVVSGYKVYHISQVEALCNEAKDIQNFFTAMGGKNLEQAAPVIARIVNAANKPVNVITCENWKEPAAILEKKAHEIYSDIKAGFAESVVMRSAIEPDEAQKREDPLTVNVQNYWHLPIDGSKLLAALPEVPELEPIENFRGFLERKFYTYNVANGTVSYVGSLLGLTHISEAAYDERVSEILERVYTETGMMLSKKHGISFDDQMKFAATSQNKLRDRVIVDTLERNARDPLRKLGPNDRLVGPAKLCIEYGIVPEAVAEAIACAVYYDNPEDASAEQLRHIREEQGAAGILKQICMLSEDDVLYKLVLEKVEVIRGKGWIK